MGDSSIPRKAHDDEAVKHAVAELAKAKAALEAAKLATVQVRAKEAVFRNEVTSARERLGGLLDLWRSEAYRDVFIRLCNGESLAEVGALQGVSPERVRQIVSKVVREMRYRTGKDPHLRSPQRLRDMLNLPTGLFDDYSATDLRKHRDFWLPLLDETYPPGGRS